MGGGGPGEEKQWGRLDHEWSIGGTEGRPTLEEKEAELNLMGGWMDSIRRRATSGSWATAIG
jgi:hypothetical protein